MTTNMNSMPRAKEHIQNTLNTIYIYTLIFSPCQNTLRILGLSILTPVAWILSQAVCILTRAKYHIVDVIVITHVLNIDTLIWRATRSLIHKRLSVIIRKLCVFYFVTYTFHNHTTREICHQVSQ